MQVGLLGGVSTPGGGLGFQIRSGVWRQILGGFDSHPPPFFFLPEGAVRPTSMLVVEVVRSWGAAVVSMRRRRRGEQLELHLRHILKGKLCE